MIYDEEYMVVVTPDIPPPGDAGASTYNGGEGHPNTLVCISAFLIKTSQKKSIEKSHKRASTREIKRAVLHHHHHHHQYRTTE